MSQNRQSSDGAAARFSDHVSATSQYNGQLTELGRGGSSSKPQGLMLGGVAFEDKACHMENADTVRREANT